jgi:hypothetical protein
MPPQQRQRLADVAGDRFDFGAHCSPVVDFVAST